jgi:hypothetical protein
VIRITLRQFRTEAIVGFGLLVVLAIVLAVSGVNLAHVNDAFQAACKAADDCASTSNPVLNTDNSLQSALQFVVVIAPALLGLFFGAPLIARELESGTFRLAWTQSVTRQRWLAVKLGLVGLAAMAISGLLTWMVDWWASPIDAANANRFDPSNFGFHGVAPIGYAAFAFALGATSGVLLRRTVAAMPVTLVGFVAARLAVTFWVRPHLWSPTHKSLPLSTVPGSVGLSVSNAGSVSVGSPLVKIPNAWVYSTSVVNKAGHAPTSLFLTRACPALVKVVRNGTSITRSALGSVQRTAIPASANNAVQSCTRALSATLHTVVSYQPASRFWPLQLAEMGIFLAAALALCGLMYWWLRRRYA